MITRYGNCMSDGSGRQMICQVARVVNCKITAVMTNTHIYFIFLCFLLSSTATLFLHSILELGERWLVAVDGMLVLMSHLPCQRICRYKCLSAEHATIPLTPCSVHLYTQQQQNMFKDMPNFLLVCRSMQISNHLFTATHDWQHSVSCSKNSMQRCIVLKEKYNDS